MRLTVRASFVAYLLTIALFASVNACLGAIIALAVHEASHLLIGFCLGERFDRIEIAPFGGLITSEQGNVPFKGWRGALIAAAGPIGNYFAIMVLSAPVLQRVLSDAFLKQAVLANTVMMLFNLLPVLPLDGGRIAFSLGYYIFGVSQMIRILCAGGVALGVALIGLSAFGFARFGIINLSAVIVGGYLIASAVHCYSAMLTENLYAVVHERCTRTTPIRHMKVFQAAEGAKVLSLLKPMEQCESAGFIVRTDSGACYLDEEIVCQALLRDPAMTIGEVINMKGKNWMHFV